MAEERDYHGTTVVVTGAAQGIGYAVAEAYARQGARVVMADKDPARLAEAANRLQAQGGDVREVVADVRQPADVTALMAAAAASGRLEVLINNAGVTRWQSPLELSVEAWDDVLNTNLRGAFLCAQAAARIMRKLGRGAIVNIASTRALMSEPNSEAYAASKGGLLALTHALAISLGPLGIRVNAISPGWIETGDYTTLRPQDHAQHPAGWVGRPVDIARACLYLTHPENRFVTGINLVVDGGMTRKMIYEP
ncbi:MAG: SDR family oxidoreductase [Alicyclobacillus sp.]|nr:SDR family oxidoreductase [Alicyclobacillus sp.]